MDVNEVDYIKIGQRIRAARLKLGWQQAEVAFRAGLTTSHMSHIETGQTKVALPTIVKIANTLSVSVDEALYLLSQNKLDLVLLDLMLPGLSGEEVLPHIKNIPVIVLSAKVDVQDKVNLLLSGAADYITKPFDTKELLARITVQLRKAEQHEETKSLSIGYLVLDMVSLSLTVQGKAVKLTRTEYAILKLLMENPKQVIAKSVLLDRISLDTPDCTERSLKQHISNLRKKLQDVSGVDYIETVWGIGFKLAEQKS